MKITASELRNKAFEKGFRGYVPEKVEEYLHHLAEEWSKLADENKMLRMQLEIAEKELNKLKEIELTLFKTLKNAEESSNSVLEKANSTAEHYLQEARGKSDDILNDSRKKASMLVQDMENKANYIREEIQNDLAEYEREFRAIEKLRENMLTEMREVTRIANENISRIEKKFAPLPIKDRLEELRKQSGD